MTILILAVVVRYLVELLKCVLSLLHACSRATPLWTIGMTVVKIREMHIIHVLPRWLICWVSRTAMYELHCLWNTRTVFKYPCRALLCHMCAPMHQWMINGATWHELIALMVSALYIISAFIHLSLRSLPYTPVLMILVKEKMVTRLYNTLESVIF